MRITSRFLLVLMLLPAALPAQDDPFADDAWEDWDTEAEAPLFTGFVEGGAGIRGDTDPLLASRRTLEEIRARLESEWRTEAVTLTLKADGGYDGVEDDWIGDVRELAASFTLGDDIDVILGRQVQTWGTGDLVFLNDLFPKDFVSFFAGREDEYLKAPGDSVRITRYGSAINVDFVWTPRFEPDRYLDGERFSFFSPLAGTNVAPDPPFGAIEPAHDFSNGEFALRLFTTVGSTEYALYGYRGFFKQPNAFTGQFEATFAPLAAIGASIRLPAGPGLFNAETAYYDSRDDDGGDNPLVPNSQLRLLAGFEWEAVPNFNVGFQYYLEWTLDHDALIANSPFPAFEPDEFRHLLTNRLTWRLALDRYTWSLFSFVSPSDRDFHLRPAFDYRHSDTWTLTAGANLFGGHDPHTFFGQLEDASNFYLRLRFNY